MTNQIHSNTKLHLRVGLTLAGCQAPTKVLYHSPSSTRQWEGKYDKRLVSQAMWAM